MNIVPFKAEHLSRINIQSQQKEDLRLGSPELYGALEHEESFTALDVNGEVLGCGGVVGMTETRACAWTYLADNLKTNLVPITKACKAYFKIMPYKRLEIHVDCDFANGHRWARMLGFELECERMRCFTPDGRDCALYAMVKI